MSPDPRYYNNKNFESEVVENTPTFEPEFYDRQKPGICDASKVKVYEQLRQVFPNAEFIGYVPPVSAWNVANEIYSRGLIDCYLSSIHQLSKIYDVMYDFSVPSSVTTEAKNTYDGSHYYPEIQEKVSKIIQGKPATFGIKVENDNFAEYQKFYKMKIKEFLEKEGEGKRWRGGSR